VETLLLLCTTRWGRDHLRTHGVYQVVRILHENEEDEQVAETIERLVNMLKRDEAASIEEEGVEEANMIGDGSKPSADDDDDDKIVEV
jgi:hypothetical protein